MATLYYYQRAINGETQDPNYGTLYINNLTTSYVSVTDNYGNGAELYGSFILSGGKIQSGIVTSYNSYTPSLAWSVTGLSLSIATVVDYVIVQKNTLGLITAALSGNDSIVGSSANDGLLGFNGNDTINGGGGNDTLTGGNGNDRFVLDSGLDKITDLGLGADSMQIGNTAKVSASVYADWRATSTSINNGTLTLVTAGHAVDLTHAASGNGWAVKSTGNATKLTTSLNNSDTLTAGKGNDTLISIGNQDSLIGGSGSDTFDIKSGSAVITHMAKNATLLVEQGATANVILSSNWLGAATITNHGSLVFTDNGYNIDLSAVTTSTGFTINNTSANAITIVGFNAQDTILGGTGGVELDLRGVNHALTIASDEQLNHVQTIKAIKPATTINVGLQTENFTINASSGHDTLVSSQGHDTIIAGVGDSITLTGNGNTLLYHSGSSGITTTTENLIYGLHKGEVGVGDTVQYNTALTVASVVGQSSLVSSINNQGVVTFTDPTKITSLSKALTAIATAISGGNAKLVANGEFAFFQLQNTGDEYLYISSGNEKAPSAHDTVIKLVGIATIGQIDLAHLTAGSLTITV